MYQHHRDMSINLSFILNAQEKGTVNSKKFARVLFSRNFADAELVKITMRFRENV